MESALEQLTSCKFNLTHIILNKKSLDKKTLKEIKDNLLLVKSLSEKIRKNSELDCLEEIVQVQEYVARIR